MTRLCTNPCCVRIKDWFRSRNLSSSAWFFILWFGGVLAVFMLSYGVKLFIYVLKKTVN